MLEDRPIDTTDGQDLGVEVPLLEVLDALRGILPRTVRSTIDEEPSLDLDVHRDALMLGVLERRRSEGQGGEGEKSEPSSTKCMNHRGSLTFLVLLSMLAAGCTGIVEPTPVEPVELPDDPESVQRSTVSPQLIPYADCDELAASLRVAIAEEARVQLLQAVENEWGYYSSWRGGFLMEDGAVAEMAMDGATATPTSGSEVQRNLVEGTDFSGTNNQETGVDESDIVKTDGEHIYMLHGSDLKIIAVPEFGSLEPASDTRIEGTPSSMMRSGDHLVVISNVNPWNIPTTHPLREAFNWGGEWNSWRSSQLTKFTVLDVSNASSPEPVRELYIEGWSITAREVAGTVRAVTHGWMDIPGIRTWLDLDDTYYALEMEDPLRRTVRLRAAQWAMQSNQDILDRMTIDDLLPAVHELRSGNLTTHRMSNEACADFSAPEDALNRGITSIMTLDLMSETFAFEADHLVSNWPLVYSSTDAMVIAESSFSSWWFWGNDDRNESTNLHTFDIGTDGRTTYSGSARIDGTVLDQFCISEHEGVLRVATTTGQWGRWWMEEPEPMVNHIVTLAPAVDPLTGGPTLQQLGHLGGIAEGERIWSARFVGDLAYLVTFEQIDPLWTIDLADPTNPVILGELEVPGVSTYIHPLEDHLLTIGIGPRNADGTGLDWSSTQISLFDVSNLSAPTRDDVLRLTPVSNPHDGGWTWSYSEATYEHKAFVYWAPEELLAIPLSTYRYTSDYDANGNYRWSYEYVSTLQLIDVNTTTGNLSIHGVVDHSDLFDRAEDERQHYWDQPSIRRTIFMGDTVVAISSAGITAHTTDDPTNTTDSIRFDRPQYASYYVSEPMVDAVEEEPASSDGEGAPPSEGASSSEDGDASGETTASGSA